MVGIRRRLNNTQSSDELSRAMVHVHVCDYNNPGEDRCFILIDQVCDGIAFHPLGQPKTRPHMYSKPVFSSHY